MTLPIKLQLADLSAEQQLLTMIHVSFKPLYDRYHDDATSPYLKTITSWRTKIRRPGSATYFINQNAANVGMIRIITNSRDQTARISPLLILPAYQRHGRALATLVQLPKIFPNIQEWCLETIESESGLISLYQRAGFERVAGKWMTIQPGMRLVYLHKYSVCNL
ncbi:GNAT family N-acetyltransferase [Lactiplantibacillus paraplantarum]|uniref:GNAT family N-acetyltransferase n=1 Tax=Lactiplantibacillus paraplantarum TaxID=60520 RepID=UPI003DA5F811